ncbi:hypothetical protein NP233_g12333 [Leucocoprinus birnbaumii]|uniref:Uncharacterized protein n=1 Tax=Leucocoprinus birnbaumii TaxID=56174 RepID=A0AAD5VEL2_9AGAR|nr:hypothetical protein NP233_g12333 [Leucocoprinus birnbaumii]
MVHSILEETQHLAVFFGPVPLPGCSWVTSRYQTFLDLKFNLLITIVQISVTGTQALLTIIKIIQTLKVYEEKNQPFYERVSHIRMYTPVIYTFYRDGTLYIIPILGITQANSLNVHGSPLNYIDWEAWRSVVYHYIASL